MDIMELGAIGELVGGVALIATLAYLSIQIKQNTRAVQSTNFHGITNSFNAINFAFAQDESTARVYRVGYGRLEDLTHDERVRFGFLYLGVFRVFETLFFEREAGTVDPRLWEAEKRSMGFLLNGSGAREWWNDNPYSLTREFREFVDTEILASESDPSIHP